jgi:hypothetical protein
VGAEVGWHLRFVQAGRVDVWAEASQAGVLGEVAATFTQWRMEREEVDGAVRFSFSR